MRKFQNNDVTVTIHREWEWRDSESVGGEWEEGREREEVRAGIKGGMEEGWRKGGWQARKK